MPLSADHRIVFEALSSSGHRKQFQFHILLLTKQLPNMTQERPVNALQHIPANSPLLNLGFHIQRFKRAMILSGEVPEWVLEHLNELLDIVLDSCTKLELKLEYKLSRISNILNRMTGVDGFIVPFLDGTLPPANCAFKTAKEIDDITKYNMILCLNGYDIAFDEGETPAQLKAKLRDALGLIGTIDDIHEYSDRWA